MAETAVQTSGDDHLLLAQDGPAFEVINAQGKSRIVLICEHASNRVPQQLNNLGLTPTQLDSHIGWDPGSKDLALGLSKALNAPLVAARFSRLVYDCNRPPEALNAMPHQTEVCLVPGNSVINPAERQARTDALYVPFHVAVSKVLQRKRDEGLSPIIITIHSFTPVFNGEPRAVEIGYLHGDDAALCESLKHHSTYASHYDIRLNEPYAPIDGVLHTIEKHRAERAFPSAMIEVRNDLLADENTFADVLSLLSSSIQKAIAALDNNAMQQAPSHQQTGN